MPFESGARLGPYQIVAPLGAGGMGEVYRARDTRLDRTVAIKVLGGALVADPESRRRFEEEARAIAALNDPHICTIHDVGRDGDLDYLVLEYLEGESLASRLRRTPALTMDEALAIAVQIGDALDRAHRAGIVHRDLKPGNVMLVRRDGASAPHVKLLDFGLAARTAATKPHAVDVGLTRTLSSSMMATQPPSGSAVTTGISGTVQYMAPEQLDGQEGDHRADIFAFGCVLYEMLAGRKAFEGASAVTVIAAIMSSEPAPIPALASHPLLDHVMRRCLEKDRERRWQNIADATGELRWIAEHPMPAAVPQLAPISTRNKLRAPAIIALAVVIAAALIASGVRSMRGGSSGAALPSLRLEVATPPTSDASAALSPDGTRLAFVANKDRVPMVWIRALDSTENRPLAGTEGASYPFWSPDGRSLGFFADDKLKRIDATGGRPIVIADARTARGGAWGPQDVILFSPGVSAPIVRVSATGGRVEPVTDNRSNVGPSHRHPQFLPDGRHFLFGSSLGTPETNGVYVGSLDKTTPVRILNDTGIARFAAPDRLVTVRQGVLQAYPFDPVTAKITGEPAIIAQGFGDAALNGVFGTSETGVLAYRPGVTQPRRLVWVDRQGKVLSAIGEPQDNAMGSPELSPDERSIALFLHPSATADNDVWVIEVARGVGRPITAGPPADAHPIWDPQGDAVVFGSQRGGGRGPTRFPLAGGRPQPLFQNFDDGVALAWSRDRRYMLVRRDGGTTGADLYARPLDGDHREIAVAETSADETEGQFSPDAKWVAFVSNETRRAEIFVQSFPDGQHRTQVSTAGGTQVRWSADGKEIFFLAPDGTLMSASVSLGGASPDVKLPVALFQTHLATGTNVIGNKAQFAVSRDGRFLLNEAVETASTPIVIAINWMNRLGKGGAAGDGR